VDLTVAAIPAFFTSMVAEDRYLKRQAQSRPPTAGDYTRADTTASLLMGTASITVPLLLRRLADPITPGRGRYGRALVATAAGAALATTVADVVVRRRLGTLPDAGTIPPISNTPVGAANDADAAEADVLTRQGAAPGSTSPRPARGGRRGAARLARRVASSAGVTAVATGALAGATGWYARTAAERLFRPERRDLGSGVVATVGAIAAWDFIYYWNHRFQHESRWLWAIHVVHHSSEHYNLSTALRQPVGAILGAFVPVGALSLLGFRPELIETAGQINLLYQYWIHTETIPKLGRFEEVFNTASHHRVHHGTNRQYLDRNHGSILIIWDRLFGTFECEDEPVIYGLTKNINTFNPLRVATHEYADILRDVARSETWSDRIGFAFRGPGWAYDRHAQRHDPQPLAGIS
jgi:sterol desaturase/sphingolipid hydroxylase (fatty acid hydroxylase superfamily)